MKSSASESNPYESRSKGEIPGRARRNERLSRSKLKRAFLIDSNAELFMYLIQSIRFDSLKERRLNGAFCTFIPFTTRNHQKKALHGRPIRRLTYTSSGKILAAFSRTAKISPNSHMCSCMPKSNK